MAQHIAGHGRAGHRREQRHRRGDGARARRQGATVAVAARRKDRLDALAAEIGGLAIECDVTDRDQATRCERTAATSAASTP